MKFKVGDIVKFVRGDYIGCNSSCKECLTRHNNGENKFTVNQINDYNRTVKGIEAPMITLKLTNGGGTCTAQNREMMPPYFAVPFMIKT